MKEIKMKLYTEAGRAAAKAKLDEVQKRAKVRCVSVDGIMSRLERAEKDLGNIAKCRLKGCAVEYTGAEKFPNAYKYIPESTHYYAQHDGHGWVLERVWRDTCPNSYQKAFIILTDDAKKATLEKLCTMFY